MEPAAIPSRGRFPIPMETVRLSYLIPKFLFPQSPSLLLLVLYYMSVLVNGRRFLARVLVNGRNSSQWCLGEWSWITPSNHRELWITALLGENRP